jgi:CRP-like cAMP-binding protein
VIQRALAKRPEDRFPDWDGFAAALSELVSRQLIPLARFTEVKDSERFSLLRALDFFADFGDIELWEVVRRARWRRYPVGHHLFKKGGEGNSVHILALGSVEVVREGRVVVQLGAGTSVGEMAYLAPNPELRKHATDVRVTEVCTSVSFTPQLIGSLSGECQHRFDRAFIKVLVRRLHAAHEQLAHPRRIL